MPEKPVFSARENSTLPNRQVDIQTGAIRLAGLFPNPDNVLRPGQFGRVRFVSYIRPGALLVPQKAAVGLQGSNQVAVVGNDNKVTLRTVRVGERTGAMWIIDEGLKPQERVVVEGVQRVRDSMLVHPTLNTVNPAGRLGGEPILSGQRLVYAVRAQGRLVSAEEFEEIVVRESPQGGVVRVKDVIRVVLGGQAYSVAGRLNGKPSAIVAVCQLPGSNAVDIEDRCRETGAACSISLRMVSRCGLYQMTASATFVP